MRYLSIFLVFFSFQSIAQVDRVGDFSVLEGNWQGGRLSFTAQYTRMTASGLIQRDSTVFNGQNLDTSESLVPTSDVMTPQQAGLLVALCPQIGGTLEEIDLPVGTTATCRVSGEALDELSSKNSFNGINIEATTKFLNDVQADTIWIGPFPVLAVAQMTLQGSLLKLTNYNWN